MNRIGGVAALAIALAQYCPALDPTLRFSQYHNTVWHIEQGLPNNHVTAVVHAPGGALLVGTRAGLVSFDGVAFSKFASWDPLSRLSSEWITDLLVRRDGTLCVAGRNLGLFALKGSRLELISDQKKIMALFEDSQGALWVASQEAILRRQGGIWQVILREQLHPNAGWQAFAEDSAGVVWIATESGLARYRKGAIEIALPNPTSLGNVMNVWNAGSGIGVGLMRGAATLEIRDGKAVLEGELRTGVPVVRAMRDRDGSTWVSTWGKGVYRQRGAQTDVFDTRSGLPDDFVRDVLQDREGNLWIGTRSGGLTRLRDSRIIPYGVPEGLPGHYASTVLEHSSGALWLGTWRSGLLRVDGLGTTKVALPAPALNLLVTALAEDPQGRIWVGGDTRLDVIDGSRAMNRNDLISRDVGHVKAILFDSAGRMWLATNLDGLHLIASPDHPAVKVRFFERTSVSGLLEDGAGRVWAATSKGVYRFDRRLREPALMTPDHPHLFSRIAEDGNERVWATSARGPVFVFDSKAQARVLDSADGVPSVPLLDMVDDRRGSLWFSSALGLWELKSQDAARLLRGDPAQTGFIHHGIGAGMRTIECMAEGTPASERRKDGSIWFPTAQGFAVIRPANRPALAPPRSEVLSIAVDGRQVDPSGAIQLQAGSRNVEIRYTAYRLATPELVRFRYRMQNKGTWIDAGGERMIRLAELPPGRFQFAVSARDGAGEFGEPSAPLAFEQMPAFRQTLAFKVLLFLTILALVALGGFWWLRTERQRYAAVLAERNRISEEWHDTLLAGLSAVSWQLDTLGNEIPTGARGLRERLEMARKMIQHCRVEARRVIWDLRDAERLRSTLSELVQRAAENIASATGAEVSMSMDGQVRPLGGIVEVNALRICQEAVTNAVRHGKARQVRLRLDYSPQLLLVSISDDGCGFQTGAQNISAGHFGIAGMEARARRLGGELKIESESGRGTIIEAKLPVSPLPAHGAK